MLDKFHAARRDAPHLRKEDSGEDGYPLRSLLDDSGQQPAYSLGRNGL